MTAAVRLTAEPFASAPLPPVVILPDPKPRRRAAEPTRLPEPTGLPLLVTAPRLLRLLERLLDPD